MERTFCFRVVAHIDDRKLPLFRRKTKRHGGDYYCLTPRVEMFLKKWLLM